MKEKLVTALGTAGYILWYIISIAFTFAPLIILRFPFYVNFILIVVITTVPVLGIIANVVIWIWALVVNIAGQQDFFAILYYIMFAINALYVVTSFISGARK